VSDTPRFVDRLRYSRFWPMLWKEFIQIRRDRLTLGMILVLPAAQLLLFGYAIQTDVRHLPTVVLDESRTSESRALVTTLMNSGVFDPAGEVADRATARRALDAGTANAALVIPPEYGREVAAGRTATVQMLVDAADPQTAGAAISGAQLGAQARATQIIAERVSLANPLDMRVRPLYNPAQRSAVFIVPGVIGVLLTITLTLITATAIVRERERGTLEQLIVTPIGKTSLMLGKLVPFVIVGYVQMTVVLTMGWVFFRVPIVGSLPLLYLLTIPFIIASLGVGLLISTVARSQAQAMQLSFFFMLPNILLSGYLFPRMSMPLPAQVVGLALPLTYYLKILRGLMLKGTGFADLWRPTGSLVVLAVLLFTISVRRFHKTIE
jgi:ABC-2 type transport system permease protein